VKPPFPPDPGLLQVLDLTQAMVRDLDGRIRYWSTGAEWLYGFTRGEATGRIAHELLATRFPAPLAEIEAILLRDGRWDGELQHRRKDGSTLYVASQWALQRGHDSQPDAVAEVNNDITAQRQAESALRRLGTIVASSNDAIIGMTLDGIITDWNAAAAAMFGIAEQDAIGQPITFVYPPDRMGEEAPLLARIQAGELVDHFETLRQRRSGERFPVSVNISPIRDAQGRVTGASKIVRDTSEAAAQQRRIAEIQAELTHVARLSELGQLVSALVHEVNQPLTAVGNYTKAIQRLLGSGDMSRIPAALERIVEQTERAHGIIQRLRNFVRKGVAETRSEDLPPIIEEAIALAAVGPAARGAVIRTAFAPGAERAVIDRIQIEQVLFNLLRNALEAMQGQAERFVLVSTEPAEESMIRISVADRGPGLPAEVREKLFQPFVTTKSSGLGVGLSVCRAIVEAHGGMLSAEDNPGGGTVFRFTVRREVPVDTGNPPAAG
jgi:two-component system sensor kinase FixL